MAKILLERVQVVEARRETLQTWGDWLSNMRTWDLFVTLTFRDPSPGDGVYWNKPGFGTAKRAWSEFIGATKRIGYIPEWARFFEMQKVRGVPHIHALVGNVAPDLRRMDLVRMGYDRWGITRVEKYEASRGAGYYLCKYVTKELSDIAFSKGIGGQ